MKLIVALFLVAGLANCGKLHAQALNPNYVIPGTVVLAPMSNSIYIEQIGTNNNFKVNQDGNGQSATIKTGANGSVDNSSISITQQGIGSKTANVELTNGYSNSVTINQDGNGQHSATVQNYTGSANSISISQTGASNNSFSVIGGAGTGNNANVINATQNGGVGADKSFVLNMNGTTGANVTVQQTNPTQPNSGSMSISCVSGACGNYSYIRN